MGVKTRLDLLVIEKGLAETRQRAQALIMAGKILVDQAVVDKPGVKVPSGACLAVKGDPMAYVSRGGLKLEAALDALHFSPEGMTCMDVGASTGGFTDCLLQRGALKVYAVDVGYGQLAWKLRQDKRVVAIERTNIRNMAPDILDGPVDLITIDVSFISLRIVVPAVLHFLKADGIILALIKPQFEVGKGNVGKGGVIRDPLVHERVIDALKDDFTHLGLQCGPVIPSPVLGPKGNQEFIIRLGRKDPE